MPYSWLVRWETSFENKPKVFLPERKDINGSVSIYHSQQGFAVFAGDLFDKSKLHPDPEATPAECIAHTYEVFGDKLFECLRGKFALAVWDQQQKRLIAGRDAMGLFPFYYSWDGHRLLLSPHIDQILAQPDLSREFNRVMLAEYLLDIHDSYQGSETFFTNIQRLPAAHQLCVTNNRLAIDRYWDPIPPGFPWLTAEELADTQRVLTRAVKRCLESGADSLALSGGFDSVSIAVLATEMLTGKSPLHAVSLRFNLDGNDEGETQVGVAHSLNMPQVMLNARDLLEKNNIVAASLALSQDSPTPILSVWLSMYLELFQAAARQGLQRIMLGTGGDELFTVDISYGADRMAAFDLNGLWRYYHAIAQSSQASSLFIARNLFWTFGAKFLLIRKFRGILEGLSQQLTKKLRKSRLSFEPWLISSDLALEEEVIDRLLYQPQVELAPGEGNYVQAIRGLAQSPFLLTQMEQFEAWAGKAGFQTHFPYFDRDLVEFSLRMPPEFLIAVGREKTPLRYLVADQLPQTSLPAKKAGFTQTYHTILKEQGQSEWHSFGSSLLLSDLGLVEPSSLASFMNNFFTQSTQRVSIEEIKLTWLILSAEIWLRMHNKYPNPA